MDVVYPVRREPDYDQPHLKYSIRSLLNLPHERLIVVGHLPSYLDPNHPRLVHIPTEQTSTKFWNIGTNLQAVLDFETSETFYWMNDDQFILMPFEALPLIARHDTVDEFTDKLRYTPGTDMASSDHNAYCDGMKGQRDILRAWGFDTSIEPCVDNHYPMPVYKPHCVDVVKKVRADFPDHPFGHFKNLYGAGMPSVKARDCKVKGAHKPLPPDWHIVSTYLSTWRGKVGEALRSRFPEPSPYEKED